MEWVRVDARDVVAMRSRTVGYAFTVQVRHPNAHSVRIDIVEGPPGLRAWAEIALQKGKTARHTRVRATMHADVVAVGSLPPARAIIAKVRRMKLEKDLRDLKRWYEGTTSATRTL